MKKKFFVFFFFFLFLVNAFFFFFFLQQTHTREKARKPLIIYALLCYVPLSFSLLENKRDDGQHQRDRDDDGPPTSSRATVRFCSLSLSAFFSLLLLYFFNVCANVSPHVAFREEEVTFHSLSFSLDGSIDLDFKSIPKPCEN